MDKVKMRKLGSTGSGTEILQPESGLGFSFETTYTEDSGRIQTGEAVVCPMFTVRSYSYSRTRPSVKDVAKILGFIVTGGKFEMYVFDPVTATWKWDTFYVGKGNMDIGYLTADGGHYESFSFNAVGVMPI